MKLRSLLQLLLNYSIKCFEELQFFKQLMHLKHCMVNIVSQYNLVYSVSFNAIGMP